MLLRLANNDAPVTIQGNAANVPDPAPDLSDDLA
jgi:hypothetical protein